MPELELALGRCLYVIAFFVCAAFVYLVYQLVKRLDRAFDLIPSFVAANNRQDAALERIDHKLDSHKRRLIKIEDATTLKALREALTDKRHGESQS